MCLCDISYFSLSLSLPLSLSLILSHHTHTHYPLWEQCVKEASHLIGKQCEWISPRVIMRFLWQRRRRRQRQWRCVFMQISPNNTNNNDNDDDNNDRRYAALHHGGIVARMAVTCGDGGGGSDVTLPGTVHAACRVIPQHPPPPGSVIAMRGVVRCHADVVLHLLFAFSLGTWRNTTPRDLMEICKWTFDMNTNVGDVEKLGTRYTKSEIQRIACIKMAHMR